MSIQLTERMDRLSDLITLLGDYGTAAWVRGDFERVAVLDERLVTVESAFALTAQEWGRLIQRFESAVTHAATARKNRAPAATLTELDRRRSLAIVALVNAGGEQHVRSFRLARDLS